MTALLRRWVIAGLLIWIPLGVTLLVIRFVVGVLDTSLLLLPAGLRPAVPGLGVLLSVLLVLGTGAIAANYAGRHLFAWSERWLARVPLVGSVYGGMKKLAQTLLSGSTRSFRRAVLIPYPRAGLWSVAFVTGEPVAEAEARTGQRLLTCFVPTTPNPTSGFLVLVPAAEAVALEMPVEEAMRLVISLGVVAPERGRPGAAVAPAELGGALK